jgi:hypothetical protein
MTAAPFLQYPRCFPSKPYPPVFSAGHLLNGRVSGLRAPKRRSARRLAAAVLRVARGRCLFATGAYIARRGATNTAVRRTDWVDFSRLGLNWVDFSRTENPPSRKLGGFLEIGKSTQSTGWISRGVTFFFPDTPCRKRRDNVADTTFQDERRRYDMFRTQRSANLPQATTRKSNQRRSCARPKSNGPIP